MVTTNVQLEQTLFKTDTRKIILKNTRFFKGVWHTLLLKIKKPFCISIRLQSIGNYDESAVTAHYKKKHKKKSPKYPN